MPRWRCFRGPLRIASTSQSDLGIVRIIYVHSWISRVVVGTYIWTLLLGPGFVSPSAIVISCWWHLDVFQRLTISEC